MGCWIPGPVKYSWPANRNRRSEKPSEAVADAPVAEATKPRRTRRTKKIED